MKILLVEDDWDLQEMYTAQLHGMGHRVVVAGSAQVALDKLEAYNFDVVLLDILLPEHNGVSILYELRSYEDWREIPVIILSNILPEELGMSERQYQSLRVTNYLVKARTGPKELALALKDVDGYL